jgi:hypothetical protein
VLEDRVVEVEERLSAVEKRIVGDLKAAIENRVVAAEEGIASVENRLENDLKKAVKGRVTAVEGRLDALRKHAVEELKRELHKALLVLALGTTVGLLALVAMIYGLMGAWLSLKGVLGAVTASFVLAAVFVLFSLVALGLLSSILNRARRTSVSS